jgi:hypothetical protein
VSFVRFRAPLRYWWKRKVLTPFLDLDEQNNDWLIKGYKLKLTLIITNEEYSDILNMTLNWDTSFDSLKTMLLKS